MVEKSNECLNSLRVSAKHWPGLICYQGLTTNTGLCPWNKSMADSKQSSALSRKTTPRCRYSSHKSTKPTHSRKLTSSKTTTCTDQTDNETNEIGVDATTHNHHEEGGGRSEAVTPESKPRSLGSKSGSIDSTHSALSSVSSDSISMDKDQRAKTPLSLPYVSCNELPNDGEKDGDASFNSQRPVTLTPHHMFPARAHVPSRPQTAGPRVLIPPKHTCPEGLTADDFVQGQGFGPDKNKRPHTSHGEEARQTVGGTTTHHVTLGICAESSQKSRPSALGPNTDRDSGCVKKVAWDSNLPTRRSEGSQSQGFRRLCRPLTRSAPVEERVVSLELTITAIGPSCRSNAHDVEEQDENGETEERDESRTTADVDPKSKPRDAHSCDRLSPSQPSFNNNNENIDTIEGIRKSYQRAQSAPPIHGRSHAQTPEPNASGEVKQFSNLYYRAKSAYHKRQQPPATDTVDGPSDRTQPSTSVSQGSLLRPLLYANDQGPIKHSSGCPYKCKSCFKACLVSQDYVQKAVARALLEQQKQQQQQQQQNRQRVRSASAKRASSSSTSGSNRRHASVSIISRALGKNQPLFHQVYGRDQSNNECRKMLVKPWPRYGWVDLKSRKHTSGKDSINLENGHGGKNEILKEV